MSWLRSTFKSQKSKTNTKKSSGVYLSFCCKDSGSFVSQLYTALSSEAGVAVFSDKNRLKDGDRAIKPSLLKAIGECKIAIIVFSRNYADSLCCLQELEKITECCRTTGLLVLTLFYLLDPSDGCFFGQNFYDFVDSISTEETSEKFMSWVAAINKATIFSIQVVHNDWYDPPPSNSKLVSLPAALKTKKEDIQDVPGDAMHNDWFKTEWKHIRDVVGYVTHVLHKRNLSIAGYPMRIRTHLQDVLQLLNQSEHLVLLGIWGMIGIGKSTIARYIYDLIGPYFEDKSFISFDPENILKKKQFQHKKTLVILDGVTKLEELNFWCGSHEWFGAGSKIIITTRNRHLLKVHGVKHIYKVEELDQNESLEAFNNHAFKQNETPEKDYIELSRKFIAYTEGLPLALVVLGSYMCGKDIQTWKDDLSQFKRHPKTVLNMQKALESSFENLNIKERETFFDIAYFFIGMNLKDVLCTLVKPTQLASSQISLLEDNSLITIDENNKLGMHVLLEGAAREVIESELTYFFERKTFDVFLSFRGKDGRAKFISHLHSALQNSAIYVFKDDDEIQRGDQISISLFKAIGWSRICIVVLSKNYANSRWCMLELERIMKNHRIGDMVVVPVFYEVDPSEVRKQTGEFGKNFNDLISTTSTDESTEKNWRRDLHEIGSIAGFVIIDSRNESVDINNIVRQVTLLLDRVELFVAEHPVGVESRVQTATKLLNVKKSDGVRVASEILSIQKEEDVLLLGIWGMGGMGKTTIAKAVYNHIGREFEGRSFVLDIRENWEKVTNRVSLQQQVLCDIHKTAAWKIRDVESGKVILQERLSKKRVLIVLDDVNELDQLNALCGSRKWLGPGSRIIITTRDRDLLRSCKADHVYTIKEMDESESLELFSWHAFKEACPKEGFATHSMNVVTYSGRLPLALQVLGSYLYDRGIKEWEMLLEKLKIIPNDQIYKKLKLSFDGLSDDTEKQIFLDIACFFVGMDKNNVIQILNGCNYFADIGVDVLIERSLVMVDNKNKLRMHDLLKTMGREIVREESPYDPENRSRLWLCEEVLDTLSKHKGTEYVKGLALELPRQNKTCLNTKAFKKMNKLRLLQLAGVQLDGDFSYLSRDLRWLCWQGLPLTYVPEEFQHAKRLVAIELKYSNLKQVWRKLPLEKHLIWRQTPMLENLKILNLSHSQDLATTPNFSYFPNLEQLVLKDCPSLSVVSHTIGSLKKLRLINLTDCKGLQKLPRRIYTLKYLETLILSGCSMIEKLEEDLEQMESLITLIADRTNIKKVPFSIVRSKSIGYISLCGFEGFSRDVFPSLIRSWMSPTNNVMSLVQTSASMSSLVSSNLSYDTLKDLLKLRSLCVLCDSESQLTQDVARILDALKATNCQILKASANTSQFSDMYSPSKTYLKSLLIEMGTKCQVDNMVKDNILQSATDGIKDSFLLPCDNDSDWLTFSCKGCFVIFEVPKLMGHKMKRMVLGIDYTSSSDNVTSEDCQGVLVMNYTKKTIQLYKRTTLTSFEDEEWKSITSNLEPGNKVKVMVVFGEGFIVERTTLSLLYDETNNKDFNNSHALNKEDVIISSIDVIEETSNYSNSPGEESWDDGKEEISSQNQKGKSKVGEISKSKTAMISKKGSQTKASVKIDTTSENGSKFSRNTRTQKEDSSANQSEKQKISLSGKLENIDILSENKQAADIKKDVQSTCGSFLPKGVAGEPSSTNSNPSHLDDVKKMLDIDPLTLIDQLLPNEVATCQTELSALEVELDKLHQIAFSNKLFAELPNNKDLQSVVNASIQYIESRHKDLNSQQYKGISAFSKLFNKAIESINDGNIVSYQLSQLAYEEKKATIELQSSQNEIKQEEKIMVEIEAESRHINDEITRLREKLELLAQRKNVLEETRTRCKVKHVDAMNKGKDISLNVTSIREKIEGYKSKERENNAKYVELIGSYERMKDAPPF